MSEAARKSTAPIAPPRPRNPIGVAFAATGSDRSDQVVAWLLRQLAKQTTPEQG